MPKMNDTLMLLLKEFSLARQVQKHIELLDNQVCKSLTQHWTSWVEENLGSDWVCEDEDCRPSLWEQDYLYVAHKSWIEDDLWLAFLSFGDSEDGNEDNEEDYWLPHLLGLVPEYPVTVSYNFQDLIPLLGGKEGGKEKLTGITASLATELKRAGFTQSRARKWTDHYFEKRIQLDHQTLIKAFDAEAPEEAFEPITKELERFKNLTTKIDRIIEEAKHPRSART